jgi:hypothetical protein
VERDHPDVTRLGTLVASGSDELFLIAAGMTEFDDASQGDERQQREIELDA